MLLIFFSKINFYENVRRFVGPDFGPNCLQRLSEDDMSNDLTDSVECKTGFCYYDQQAKRYAKGDFSIN